MHSIRSFAGWFAIALTAGTLVAGDRITAPVDNNRRVVLKGHVRPEVQPQNDRGLADADTPIGYATVLMRLDPSIETFLSEQQTPGSANYRRWLTPEQFGDRFGLSANDITKVVGWLESQGLKVNDVAKGRHWITFSGTAARVGRALRADIHTYLVNGEPHFANSTDPSVPEALQSVVGGFRGLNDFPAQSMLRRSPVQPQDATSLSGSPNFNSGATSHFLAPDDLATIFNIKALYDAGIDGTGQTLVIAGQTALVMNDFKLFQARFGLNPNLPQPMLFGNDPGIRSGDLVEADLDLQWSSAVARNATIIYAYATNVFTAAQYAIDNNLGQQMSISYGSCEPYDTVAYRAVAQQANAQGITMFVSSGDSGAATCDRGGPIPQATHGATASWPSSFPEITSVGGTEFNDSGSNYWASSNNVNGASALSYIPEVPWNDSNGRQLEGGGGAPSVLFAKPVWQTGPGVPNDGARDLPDISMPASPVKYAYLVESSGALLSVGGTSASSPAWAGLAALLNQYLTSKGILAKPGLGNINPALYRLAQATTDVFHDITTGDNKVPCAQSTPDCFDGMVGFSAGPGYDLATGLGSVDAFNFVHEWNSGAASTTSLTATPNQVSFGGGGTVLKALVESGGGGATPTGTIDFVTNDLTLGTATLAPSDAGKATATLSVPGDQLVSGNGSITALYGGDIVYTGSAGTSTVTLNIPASTGSYVVPWVTPNPVLQSGSSWPYTVGLTEKNGVATTLTRFTINGADNLSNLPSAIPANGTIRANLVGSNLNVPLTRVFVFSGRDADGTIWTQSISVPFLPNNGVPTLGPAYNLTTTTPVVFLNLSSDPSCQWAQQLTVQETGGYYMVLTKLTMGNSDISSQLPVIFGTTRLAPYGVLHGTLCLPGTTTSGSKTFTLTASISDGALGGTVSSSTTATLSVTSPPATPSISPEVTLSVTDDSPSKSTTVAISTLGVTNNWTAVVLPKNRTTTWLTLPAVSGSASEQITIQASGAGLSSGVYNATVVVTSNQVPHTIPVTLIVNQSKITTISGVVNNFSGSTTVAPGEMVAVFGTRMAPDIGPIVASTLPLPFALHGVSATVNGVSAPMYYVSPTQIDLQIPYEIGAGPAVLALNNGGNIAAFPLTVAATAPGLFNQAIDALTGALTTTVKQNQVLILYVTGEGDVTPTLVTGATPARQTDPTRYPTPRQAVTVSIGGVPANVLFAGIPNGIAAEMQINITVPANAPLGKQSLVLSVGGVQSPPVSLTVNAGQ
jgi:uncharacterized protein (TIGR03437 family)